VCPTELGEERQREALLAVAASGSSRRARPPGPGAGGRPDAAEQRFFAQTVGRLQAKAVDRLEELATTAPADDVASGRG
jgi:hypothetical protein